MKIKPLGGKVLVKPCAEETKTARGIIIPDTVQEKNTKGYYCCCWKFERQKFGF